eukprot:JP448075.1.p2 GENE.JP448075.1~~JP448075.1.p2  ORF type:complete len:54 (-),score=4.83 JP448075.1:44-205(-)
MVPSIVVSLKSFALLLVLGRDSKDDNRLVADEQVIKNKICDSYKQSSFEIASA